MRTFLRRLRDEAPLRLAGQGGTVNQTQAAVLLDRSQSFVSRCEQGRDVTVEELFEFCRGYGADPVELVDLMAELVRVVAGVEGIGSAEQAARRRRLGRLMSQTRSSRRLTPEAVAAQTGWTAQAVTRMESGDHEVGLIEWMRFCLALSPPLQPLVLLEMFIPLWDREPGPDDRRGW